MVSGDWRNTEKQLEKKSGIYMWTSPSGKKYIGQAVNLKQRYNDFRKKTSAYTSYDSTYKRNMFEMPSNKLSIIDKARIKYHDYNQWKYEILEYCHVDKLDDQEIYWITFYDTANHKRGYNMLTGGKGCRHTEETKQKISSSNKGKPRTEEWKKHNSEAQKLAYKEGRATSFWKGKHLPEEIIQKMKYTKQNSEYLKSDEHKQKLSNGHKGKGLMENNGNAKKVVQISVDGEFIKEWGCVKRAADELNINVMGIYAALSKHTHYSQGYRWYYA